MDFNELISKIRLWHISSLMSAGLLTLGFTGVGILGRNEIKVGMEMYAISAGVILFCITILLIYIPPRK